jgi:hypothetical protein
MILVEAISVLYAISPHREDHKIGNSAGQSPTSMPNTYHLFGVFCWLHSHRRASPASARWSTAAKDIHHRLCLWRQAREDVESSYAAISASSPLHRPSADHRRRAPPSGDVAAGRRRPSRMPRRISASSIPSPQNEKTGRRIVRNSAELRTVANSRYRISLTKTAVAPAVPTEILRTVQFCGLGYPP